MVFESLRLLKGMEKEFVSASGDNRYQTVNASKSGKTKEEVQRQITRGEAYSSKMHILRDGIAHFVVAPVLGFVTEQSYQNAITDYGSKSGYADFAYGWPLIWEKVKGGVANGVSPTPTVYPQNIIGNLAIFTAIYEGATFGALYSYNRIRLHLLNKELKKIESLEKEEHR